jgi:hypothetical protein
VQLRAQALAVVAALVGAAGLAAAAAAVVGIQEFWQVIATVSQLIWQVSVVVFKVGGVMGTGFTVWPA